MRIHGNKHSVMVPLMNKSVRCFNVKLKRMRQILKKHLGMDGTPSIEEITNTDPRLLGYVHSSLRDVIANIPLRQTSFANGLPDTSFDFKPVGNVRSESGVITGRHFWNHIIGQLGRTGLGWPILKQIAQQILARNDLIGHRLSSQFMQWCSDPSNASKPDSTHFLMIELGQNLLKTHAKPKGKKGKRSGGSPRGSCNTRNVYMF